MTPSPPRLRVAIALGAASAVATACAFPYLFAVQPPLHALPVAPAIAPERMPSAKLPIAASTALTSGMTSLPSTSTGLSDRLRSAVCSTARFSVVLIFSPANIASMRPRRSRALARFNNRSIVSPVTR